MPDNTYMWQMFIANKIVTIDIIKRNKKKYQVCHVSDGVRDWLA